MDLINNSHYHVEVIYCTDAEGGSNPGGRVVKIYKKRTGERIALPLSMWQKFNNAIEAKIK